MRKIIGYIFVIIPLLNVITFIRTNGTFHSTPTIVVLILMFIGGLIMLNHKDKIEESKQEAINVADFNSNINQDARTSYNNIEHQEELNTQLSAKEYKTIKIFWVGDKHRTHPWSIEPGGCTVVVLFKNGDCLGYDKVKRPHKYLPKVSSNYLCNILQNQKIDNLQDYIESVYAVKEGNIDLNLVWKHGDYSNPWDLLESYSTK